MVAVGASALTFGPEQCVSVYKSEETKSCVLETNCPSSVSLDAVEFAFTCKLDNMVQKHSFGKGGFDNQEKFDTSVKCNSCGLPDEVGLALKKHHVEKKKKEDPPAEEASTDPEVTKYGPEDCISTWLKPDATANEDGEKGQCVVQTNCKSVNAEAFQSYPVGLICMSKDSPSVPVRHLFGSNSFDAQEEFDTLVRCTKCLGLDEVSENVTLEAEMKGLSSILNTVASDVAEIKKSMPAPAPQGGEFLVRKHEPKKAAPAAPAQEEEQQTVVEDVYDDDA